MENRIVSLLCSLDFIELVFSVCGLLRGTFLIVILAMTLAREAYTMRDFETFKKCKLYLPYSEQLLKQETIGRRDKGTKSFVRGLLSLRLIQLRYILKRG